MPTPTLQPFYNSTMFSLALMTTRQFCLTEYKQNINRTLFILNEQWRKKRVGAACRAGVGLTREVRRLLKTKSVDLVIKGFEEQPLLLLLLPGTRGVVL